MKGAELKISVEEFFDFLITGELKGFKFTEKFKLTPKQAFRIIYVLQERYGVIPDTFELCSVCENIFDINEGGRYIEDDDELLEHKHFNKDDAGRTFCDVCFDRKFYYGEDKEVKEKESQP